MSEIPMNTNEIEAILRELSDKLFNAITKWDNCGFIGIRSGGELIAKKVVELLRQKTGKDLPLGALDIALYRDDISKRLYYPEVRSTDVPFSVDEKEIILVDDVLHTGRSVRAAIDHIVDLGRPERIYLLVLFDRGGRELPIQADFVGRVIDLPEEKIIKIDISKGDVLISEVK